MKKLIVLGIMLLGIVAMSEKLNTDGKSHLKEILGEWGAPNTFKFYQKNGELWHLDVFNYGEDEDTRPEKVTMINSYTYMIHSYYSEQTRKMNPHLKNWKVCFAYDVKHKQLAFLKCGTDEVDSYVPRRHSKFGG